MLNLFQASFQASLRFGHSSQTCIGILLTLNTVTACALVQQSMAEDIEAARAALRPWARRAEKQAARARSRSPRKTASRRTPSADQGTLARQISTGSAGGSGECSIQSHLARSSRDGDVPDLISQVRRGCCDYKRTIGFLAGTHEFLLPRRTVVRKLVFSGNGLFRMPTKPACSRPVTPSLTHTSADPPCNSCVFHSAMVASVLQLFCNSHNESNDISLYGETNQSNKLKHRCLQTCHAAALRWASISFTTTRHGPSNLKQQFDCRLRASCGR